ncbi:MAG: 30S ribosomal protein S16 [Pseudomonadota bacterium]
MAVTIRLSRGGAKKRPFYRVVAADSRARRDGRFLEKLGTYDPLLAKDDPKRLVLNEDRIRHWLDQGAQASDRIARFLDQAGMKPGATRQRGTGKRAQAIAAAKAEAAPPAEAAPAADTAPAADPEPAVDAAPAADAAPTEAAAPADDATPAEDAEPASSTSA